MLTYISKIDTKANLKRFSKQFDILEQELLKITKKIPKKLYKYCKLDTYSLNNLSNNEVSAGSPKIFNDLYDSTIHKNSFPKMKEKLERLDEISKRIGMDGINLNGFDYKLIKKDFEERDKFSMTYMTEPYRILSLSETNTSILMWSYYADNNRGICIEYDFSIDPSYQNSIFPVLYLDKPIDMSYLAEKNHEDKLLDSLLLSE